MIIREAIKKARKNYDWLELRQPTSILVGFTDKRGKLNEIELDLYSDEMEVELERLWDDLAEEMESDIDLVDYVDMIGYIRM